MSGDPGTERHGGGFLRMALGLVAVLAMALSGPVNAAPVSVAVGRGETLTFPAAPTTDGAKDGGQVWRLEQPDVSLFAVRLRQPWPFKPLRWLIEDNFLDVAASACGQSGVMSAFPPGKRFGDYILADADFDVGAVQGFHALDASFRARPARPGGGAIEGRAKIIAIGGDFYILAGTYAPEKGEPAQLAAFLDTFRTTQAAPASTMTADEKGTRLGAAMVALILIALMLAVAAVILVVRLVRRLLRARRPASARAQA